MSQTLVILASILTQGTGNCQAPPSQFYTGLEFFMLHRHLTFMRG